MSNMNYYIFSYGGCGSTMLTNFLMNFGNVYHLHDRNPPKFLSNKFKIAEKTGCKIWMDTSNPESEVSPELSRAIYIYRNPVKAVISRPCWQHTYHIEGDIENHPDSIIEYAEKGVDIRKYEEHFDNWHDYDNINYDVMYVNYDLLWDNLKDIMGYCRLPKNLIDRFPKRKETNKDIPDNIVDSLEKMFCNLNYKIENMKPCFVS